MIKEIYKYYKYTVYTTTIYTLPIQMLTLLYWLKGNQVSTSVPFSTYLSLPLPLYPKSLNTTTTTYHNYDGQRTKGLHRTYPRSFLRYFYNNNKNKNNSNALTHIYDIHTPVYTLTIYAI